MNSSSQRQIKDIFKASTLEVGNSKWEVKIVVLCHTIKLYDKNSVFSYYLSLSKNKRGKMIETMKFHVLS